MTQDHAFPDHTVRVIDPFGAAGGVDVIARAVAERLSAVWGQQVIVENHPGAGSTAAPALVAKAPADGYTLLINTSAHAYSAALGSDLPYHPLRDFVSVAPLTSQPYVLVAGAWSGITTITELVGAAEARPGEIRFASAGTATGTHLAVEKLNRDLGITALHNPPRATDAITDVIAGTADGLTAYAMLPIPTAAPRLHDGGLVALGVSTARPSRLLPDVPPLAEAGVVGFDFPIWYGIWAPVRTPPEIVSKLATDISNALTTAEFSGVAHPARCGSPAHDPGRVRGLRRERKRTRGTSVVDRLSAHQLVRNWASNLDAPIGNLSLLRRPAPCCPSCGGHLPVGPASPGDGQCGDKRFRRRAVPGASARRSATATQRSSSCRCPRQWPPPRRPRMGKPSVDNGSAPKCVK